MPDDAGKPSETEQLRRRLTRLEIRAKEASAAEPRARTAAAGSAAGAVALFLSLSLPWAREEVPFAFDISDEGVPSMYGVRASATGWDVLAASFEDERLLLAAAFTVLLVLLAVAVCAVVTWSRVLFVTVQVLAAAAPLLFLFSWPRNNGDLAAGPGLAAAVFACAVLVLSARLAAHKDSRSPDR
ncbi:hypothetical protein ACIRPH_20755 [Nocardiopsis sp. NPDC101807]|uniref:hypothetical protein n=1 Tax=Nocardiopsis sp. NPDC101807 TaxID=3364339 RepID=UPI0037FA089C